MLHVAARRCGAGIPMDDALHEDPDVGILEALDARTAPVAAWEEREHVPGCLLHEGIVVPAGDRHDEVRMAVRPITEETCGAALFRGVDLEAIPGMTRAHGSFDGPDVSMS